MMSPHKPVLDAIDLNRRIEPSGRMLLSGVSLSLRGGDGLGIIGDSGSGKTTLLRSLAFLDAPTSGQIQLRGHMITDAEVPAFRRQVIYLPQQPAFTDGTVLDNLRLAFGFASARREFDEPRAVNRLREFGRDATLLSQPTGELSGGERQMIALVRALLLSPTVLLLDEPTAAMDAGLTDRLETIVRQWRERNGDRAYAWISHDQQQLERVTNRRLRIVGGQLHES